MNKNYLPEIDGLRGLAIFIIFLSHIPLFNFASGGVNIFFVLSGFLITQIIETKYSSKLNAFYSSRIKSLYPQLITAIIFILIIYSVFGSNNNINTVIESAKYALLGLVNYQFLFQGIIYGKEGFMDPIGPLWAFSVIIQFYIVYGFIQVICFKSISNKQTRFKIIFFITIISYLLFSLIKLLYPENPFTNFYSLFTRFWQFLLGASAFYYYKKIYNSKKKYLNLLGFSILVIWQILPGFNNNFILQTTLLSLSTILIIFSSGDNNVLNKFLSSKLMVGFGKISYPFYLYHMIAINVIYNNFYHVDFFHIIFIFSILCLLSSISIKFNRLIHNVKKVEYMIIFILILSIFSLTKYQNNISNMSKYINLFEIRKSNHKDDPFIKSSVSALKDIMGKSCHPLNYNCDFNKSSDNRIILLGTSHMAAISLPLKESLTSKLGGNYNVRVLTQGGCPYLLGFYRKDKKNSCNEDRMEKIRKILNEKKSIIVISQRWPLYLSGNYYINHDGKHEAKDVKMEFLSSMDIDPYEGFYRTLNDLSEFGHKIILVYPVPEFGIKVGAIINKFNPPKEDLFEPFYFYQERAKESFKLLDSIKGKNIKRVYPHKINCDQEYCFPIIQNKLIYSDDDHLNFYGANFLADSILKKINEFNFKQ